MVATGSSAATSPRRRSRVPELPDGVAARMQTEAGAWLLQLLRDQELIDALVEPRVRQMVMAGHLVPRERLQVGAEIELAPLGLEQAARAVVQAAKDIDLPELGVFNEALGALILLLDPSDVEIAVELEPEPEHVDEPAPDAAQDEPTADEETYHCVLCGVEVDYEQHLASKTRWRKTLCKEDHATYDPKNHKKAS